MLYFQIPVTKKMPEVKVTLEIRKQLALKYLEACKTTRSKVDEDPNGVFKLENLEIITQEIIRRQNTLPKAISSKKTTGTISVKPSIFRKTMSFSGILGYYNPFTAEAQYNSELPTTYLPFTIAHETAHQLGFAREQEANFTGFLLGISSENQDLKYSTQYFTLRSLLNSIVYEEEKFVENVLKNYSAAMKRDRTFEKKFASEHKSWLDKVFGFTNDLFLKSNRQDGSVTYSYFVNLLVQYENSVK